MTYQDLTNFVRETIYTAGFLAAVVAGAYLGTVAGIRTGECITNSSTNDNIHSKNRQVLKQSGLDRTIENDKILNKMEIK